MKVGCMDVSFSGAQGLVEKTVKDIQIVGQIVPSKYAVWSC